MVDRDSGQRTAALVIALWRAAWIWRWFVQPAIVWCRGARPRRPLHRHPPYTARTLRWRWQARRGVVVGPRPMLGKRRPPWGGSSVVAAGPRGGGHMCRSKPQRAWGTSQRSSGGNRRRFSGVQSAIQCGVEDRQKKQVCCACACVLFLSGDIPRSARCSLWRPCCREYHL